MSFRLSSLRICLGVVAVAASSLSLCSAHAGGKERGRSIEFTEPKSDEVTTNLHQLTSRKDGLTQLEEDLNKPLQMFAPKSSLEGVVAPVPRPATGPVIQNKRVKELLERRKNWMFMSPEDLLSGPTVEEILKAPQYDANGQEKKEVSSLDQYYKRLATKRPARSDLNQTRNEDLFGPSKTANPRDQAASQEDWDLPSGLKQSVLALKQLSESDGGADPFGQRAPRSSFSDTFGLDENALSKEQVLAHQKYMDEYHSLVDPGWHPPVAATPANPLPNLLEAAQPTGNPGAGLGGLPGIATHTGLEAQTDITHPLLGPPPLPDPTAQALGQPRLAPTLPMVESPKVVAPTFTAPKRTF